MTSPRERPSVVQVVGEVVAHLQGASTSALSQAREVALSTLAEQLERARSLMGELEPGAAVARDGDVSAQVDSGLRRARAALEQLGLSASLSPLGATVSQLGQRTQWVLADQAERVARHAGRSFMESMRPGSGADVEQHACRLDTRLRERRAALLPVVMAGADSAVSPPTFVRPGGALRQGVRTVGLAALSAGAVGLGQVLLTKYLQGRNVFRGELGLDDWGQVFLRAGQHGLGGAAAAATVYSLTGLTRQGAPFAAGYVSSAQAVVALHREYREGTLDERTFLEMAQLACAEGAALSLAQAAGHTLIPWARLGPALGTLAGQWVTHLADTHLGGREPQLVQQLVQQVAEFHKFARRRDQPFLAQLERSFSRSLSAVGSLAEVAFDARENRALWRFKPPSS